jgi:hypothetical protein
MRFAAQQLARKQVTSGRHYIMEGSSQRLAWQSVPELKELIKEGYMVESDQCFLGLRAPKVVCVAKGHGF